MKIAEVAKNYGVPMPETCKKLNWNKETLLCWIKFEDDNEEWLAVVTNGIIYASIENVDNFVLIGGDNKLYNAIDCDIEYIIPAPQFHEISVELSEMTAFIQNKDFVCYEIGAEGEMYYEDVTESGVCEAVAKLYLKRKGKEYADIVNDLQNIK